MILKNLFTLWHLGPHIASSSGLKASCHEWPGLSVRSLTSRLEGSSDSVDFKPIAKRLDNESSGLDAKDGFLPYCFFSDSVFSNRCYRWQSVNWHMTIMRTFTFKKKTVCVARKATDSLLSSSLGKYLGLNWPKAMACSLSLIGRCLLTDLWASSAILLGDRAVAHLRVHFPHALMLLSSHVVLVFPRVSACISWFYVFLVDVARRRQVSFFARPLACLSFCLFFFCLFLEFSSTSTSLLCSFFCRGVHHFLIHQHCFIIVVEFFTCCNNLFSFYSFWNSQMFYETFLQQYFHCIKNI